MPRSRQASAAAGARLAAVLPAPTAGGWVPPPVALVPEPAVGHEDEDEDEDKDEVAPVTEDAEGGQALAGRLAGWVPEPLRGGRWDPGRRGLGALAAVAVLAALVSGALLVRGRTHAVAAPTVLAGPAAAPGAAASDATGALVVVDVAGRVRRPGLVRLPLGARVDDAVRAAGGPLPGASYDGLNRARKLTDGEQVVVGVQPAPGSAGVTGDGRLDLNVADLAALDGLPGIGPVLAQKIIDWRTEHSRFASVDQLREVGGIGESKYAALKSKVRV